jgi:hypothetical protein
MPRRHIRAGDIVSAIGAARRRALRRKGDIDIAVPDAHDASTMIINHNDSVGSKCWVGHVDDMRYLLRQAQEARSSGDHGSYAKLVERFVGANSAALSAFQGRSSASLRERRATEA